MAPLAKHYQAVPLLQEIQREQLPRSERIKIIHRGHAGGAQRGIWERFSVSIFSAGKKKLQGKHISYEPRALEDLFQNFRQAVETATSEIPRFSRPRSPGQWKNHLDAVSGVAGGSGLSVGARSAPACLSESAYESGRPGGGKREIAEQELAVLSHSALQVCVASRPMLRQWRRWLQRGEVLLLLDGLDEVEGHHPVPDAPYTMH